jgi:hypothetical protein
MIQPSRIASAVGFGLILATAVFAHHLGQTTYDASKKINKDDGHMLPTPDFHKIEPRLPK